MVYEVPIIYRGQRNYIVEANSGNQALKMATERFQRGSSPDVLGNEWEEISYFGRIQLVNPGEVKTTAPESESAKMIQEQNEAILSAIQDEIVEDSRLEVSSSTMIFTSKVSEIEHSHIILPKKVVVQLNSDDLLFIALWQIKDKIKLGIDIEGVHADAKLTVLKLGWSPKEMTVEFGVEEDV